jgi:hypothetical protein
MPSPRRYLLVPLALVPLAAVCAALWCGQRPRVGPVGPDWNGLRFHRALTEAGLDYEGALVRGSHPGYYLKPRGDPRPFEELAAIPRRVDRLARMRGFVVVVPAWGGAEAAGELGPEHGQVQLGGLIVMGDPALLRAIVEALR